MAAPTAPVIAGASAPVATAAASPSQSDLVLQQFAAAKNKLLRAQQSSQDQAAQDLQRRQAMGGLTGGASTKVLEKSQAGIANQYASTQADLDAQKAQALQGIQATKEAQQYQTGEREASQAYASSETAKAQNIQQQQFNQTYGLQQQQMNEAKRQFDQQMGFTYNEFNENQKTNLINAAIALHESSIDSAADMNAVISRFQELGLPYTAQQAQTKKPA